MSEIEQSDPWQQVPETLPRFHAASMFGIGAATLVFVLLTWFSMQSFSGSSSSQYDHDSGIQSREGSHSCGLPHWLETSFEQHGSATSTTTNIVWTSLGINAVWVVAISIYLGQLMYYFIKDCTPLGRALP